MKYTAFISYNSKDDKWAKWLQRKLESYNMPVQIRNEQDELIRLEGKSKKLRIFRYRADLNTISLNEGLAKELDDARWLIVICSPNSARSEWVGKEIQHFINTGRKNRIIPFIVDGTSYSNGAEECLNPVLKAAFPDGDILGVNINDYGDDPYIYRKRKALVRTVSMLIELPDAYSYMWNRYRMRYWESLALKVASAVAMAGLLVFVLNYHAPFDMQVQLMELSEKNEHLPQPDSLCLTLKLDNEEKSQTLTTTDAMATYKNLPGDYAGKKKHLTFSAYGYAPIDTLVELQSNNIITIGILRDDTFEILAGSVVDEQGNPLSGAVVEAEGQRGITDGIGYFELHIPLERQRLQPHVSISKEGYNTELFTEQRVGRDWKVMLLTRKVAGGTDTI